MKKSLALSVLALTSVGLVLNHLALEPMDHSYILNVDGQRWDAGGAVLDAMTRWSRHCEPVQVSSDAVPTAVLEAIRAHSPPQSHAVKGVQWLSSGTWYLAEVTFPELEPAVIVLKNHHGHLQIQDRGIWSGPVGPWRPGPWIRRYLLTQVPSAPADLLACYEPTPGLFRPH